MSSPAPASPSAPRTSNMNETATSVPSAPEESKSDSGHAGGAYKPKPTSLWDFETRIHNQVHLWRNGKWFFRTQVHGPHRDDVIISVQCPKNKAVRGALDKLKRGIPAKRVTTEYMMEGIRKWLDEERGSVVDSKQEEAFVKYVWHHMRQKQRDTAAAIEAERLQRGLACAKGQLGAHYAEFPDECKTDEELVSMFRKLDVWSSVVSSEQRRIASKKRHDKEERLIHEKFCGDRAAYNHWKALNEKVALGRIRDVSPQLLVKFAKWFEENPDFLYPGSKDTSILNAEHYVRDPLSYQYDTLRGFHNIKIINADVSKEHMLTAIKELMSSFTSARFEVTLEFDRSPHEFVMTDKYALLNMHGCQRLISGEKHAIIAVNDDRLVFDDTTIMIKRLPDEFHKQLKGHCEREGLFKELECHRVFAYTPGLITKATISGQVRSSQSDCENFKIELRLTSRANRTFSFEEIRHKKRLEFVESLRKEATEKRTETKPKQPSPAPGNMVESLLQLGQMYIGGLLTKEEFDKAKADLL
ncbi:hypothetical protein N9A45_00945 [bacterium]|nr:hypothetical protein [bacterium]